METWVFIGHCFDGAPFELEGINVWRGWQATGERAQINDPLYGWQQYDFPVYTLTDGTKTVEFAAGEFSNTVWGFFQRQKRPLRPRQPMSEEIIQALTAGGLMEAYRARPAYQQNDYLGWINRAKRPETQAKRLNQMLDELKKGGVYMQMEWPPGK